jgi:diguanylate cyclase (GGDEF)-like protein
VIAWFLLMDVSAAIWGGLALSSASLDKQIAVRFAVMLATALLFEEGAKRAGQLSFRLNDTVYRDMVGVWAIASAFVLPAGPCVAFNVVLHTYIWFRQYKPTGTQLCRRVLTVSVYLLSGLTANALVAGRAMRLTHDVWSPTVILWMVAGIVAFTVVNRVLIGVSWVLRGVKPRELLDTWDETLTEYADLCLGGLVTAAVVIQPWLTPLVLVPMVALQRASLVRRLEQVAITDAKTGLLNGIGWEHMAQRELTRSERENSPLAVVMVDIDYFKLVNDRYGHLVGDEVLKGIGDLIASELRGYDSAGRFGGEEFVAILPKSSDVEALAVAERIRQRIADAKLSQMTDFPIPEEQDFITVSIGVAVTPTDGLEVTDLLHAADTALYAAKEGGRNRVELARRGPGEKVRDLVLS